MFIHGLVASVWVWGCASAGGEPEVPVSSGVQMFPSFPSGESAEQVAVHWVHDQFSGSTAAVLRTWPRLPGVFVLETVPQESVLVVVQQGRVASGRGLAAVAEYLESISFYEKREVTPADLQVLFGYFEAWPKMPSEKDYPPSDRPFSSRGRLSQCDPVLRFEADRAEASFSYERAAAFPEGVRIGGSPSGRSARTFWKWTVAFAPGVAPVERSEIVVVR
jgi:hypothetical protein